LRLEPLSLDLAVDFVLAHGVGLELSEWLHQRARFAVGLDEAGELVAAAVAGLARDARLADGYTLELVLAIRGRTPVSQLFGATRRAAYALGFRRVYIVDDAWQWTGALRGAGWRNSGVNEPRGNALTRWEAPPR
jgi:hypothetical protein